MSAKINAIELPRSRWCEFFDVNERSCEGSIFCTQHWIEAIEPILSDSQKITIFAVEIEGRVVAGCLALLKQRPFARVRDLPFTPYTGLIFDDQVEIKKLKSEIERKFIQLIVKMYSFTVKYSPDYLDPRAYAWNKLELQPFWTFRIDRNDWMRSKKIIINEKSIGSLDAFQISSSKDIELLKWFWNITYQPSGCSSIFEFLSRIIISKSTEFFVIYGDNGKPAAGMLYLTFKKIGYGYGTLFNGNKGTEYDFIRYHIITKKFQEGVQIFDWCGANVIKRNMFKADLKPKLIPYFQVKRRTRSDLLISRFSKFFN